MKKLDRFILKAFIGPFVAILIVVVFILMMQTLWLYIDELVGKGLGLRTILEFLFWGVCSLALPLALPLATLLAATMTIGQLAENGELMAMKASGISFGRIIAPLALASALIACGTFFVCSRLVPHAFNQIYTLRDDIARTKDEIKIPPGTFYDGIDGYILRVGSQDKDTKMLHDVQVYDHTAHKGNISVTMADSAIIKMAKSKDYLTFSLYHGSTYREDNTLRYNDTSLVLQHIDFARQELLIPLKNYSFEKSDSARFDDQIKTKQMDELRTLSDSLGHYLDSDAQAAVRRGFRYSSAFQLARRLATARRGRPRGVSPNPPYLSWKRRARPEPTARFGERDPAQQRDEQLPLRDLRPVLQPPPGGPVLPGEVRAGARLLPALLHRGADGLARAQQKRRTRRGAHHLRLLLRHLLRHQHLRGTSWPATGPWRPRSASSSPVP